METSEAPRRRDAAATRAAIMASARRAFAASGYEGAGVREIASGAGVTAMQVALAWLLHRAPNILLIPGTSSVSHLRENLGAAELVLSAGVLAELDAIGKART